jgi:mono/diheme cytochrome c family protein
MKKFIKIISYIVLGVVVIAIGGIMYLNFAFPKVSKAPVLKVESTPEQIQRGKYLANHVAVCMDCHSKRNWEYFAGPPIEETFGAGGELFDEKGAGVPGTLYSKNLTQAALQNWTDGDIYHAITTGVTKSGSVIFPIMPWMSYAKMDPQDIKAIIAYIRTLKPIKNEFPESKLNFPLNMIAKTFPKDPQPMERPLESDSVNYGRYLVSVAACGDCHTPVANNEKIPGKEFAGGFSFQLGPMGTVVSANITPDQETGIGNWTEDMFVQRFKSMESPTAKKIKVAKGEFQTVMPWVMYAGMSEGDLRSIYKYLMSQKPINNSIKKFTPAS